MNIEFPGEWDSSACPPRPKKKKTRSGKKIPIEQKFCSAQAPKSSGSILWYAHDVVSCLSKSFTQKNRLEES